ncbi:hypothetical protein RAS1_16020 [Phycisphaerae bacterium RAS1]|nr:hypothetical protein RAS1_16020 [Phycisphaerae bacterium RAS1]
MSPIFSTLVDLDSLLGNRMRLIIAGGLGLYLKQVYLEKTGTRTLVKLDRWPVARTTEDIDLFLPAALLVSRDDFAQIRTALDTLGFAEVESAKHYQFVRAGQRGKVKVDVHIGPLGPYGGHNHAGNDRRARPKGKHTGLHARRTDEALGAELEPFPIPLDGVRSDGTPATCEVHVPSAFPYAMMKLFALRDRLDDPDKSLGRHHALDLYRIIAMLTEEDERLAGELALRFRHDSHRIEALRIARELFSTPESRGSVRLREHPLAPGDFSADWLRTELVRLIDGPPAPG